MADKDQSEKKSQNSFSFKGRAIINRLRIGLRLFYRKLPYGMRWTLLVLSVIAILSSLVLFIAGRISSSSKEQVSSEIIAKQAVTRLNRIVDAISNLRDTIATDSAIIQKLGSDSPSTELFEIIYRIDSLKESKFSDILPFTESGQYSFLRGRGVAYYDATKHLTSWNSSRVVTTNFDSIFSYSSYLEKHSKTILVDNEQMFAWIIAIRKIISKDGALLGYIIAKEMIGERYQLGTSGDRQLTIFDDIITNSGREVQFLFPSSRADTSYSKNEYPLYLDPGDSSSIVGTLKISNTPTIQQTGLQKIVRFVRDAAFVLFIFIFIWLASWYIAQLGSNSKTVTLKLISIGSILFIFATGRILLLLTSSLSSIIPQSLQDPQDFAVFSGFGILTNPLELFITFLFITTLLALAWVIFVPERADWKTAGKEVGEEAVFSTSGWVAKIVSIASIILLFPLVNILFAAVCNLFVSNGSYHYLGNKFGFSKGSFTLMEASFLLLGVSYFFLTLFILLFTLRSMIRLTASELSPKRSYFAHYIFFTVIITLVSWFFSPKIFTFYPDIYWAIISFLLCIITVVIFSRDIALLRTAQKGPSFFYRIPRSGLALLFLLSGAGFVLSPLIATDEYTNDIEIVKQNLQHNSQVNDLAHSSFLDQTFLAINGDEASVVFETSLNIKNLAFNIWLKYFSETTNKNVVIEVQDLNGKTISHFAQNTSPGDEVRLKRIKDSLVESLGMKNKNAASGIPAASYLVGSEPGFTATSTPASIGVGYLTFPQSRTPKSYVADSLAHLKVILSISIWNDLFPQAVVHSLYDIVRSSNISADKLTWQDQDVFYAQYHNGSLQNSSTSVVELPSHISDEIDSGLRRKEFVTNVGQIEGRRSYTIYHTVASPDSVGARLIAGTILIPGLKSLLELTLSLNTVSLFIGFFLIFFALLLRSLFSKGKRGTLKFRDRIFLIVLTIALVPLIIVTNITRSLLVEREQRIEREHLQRDATIISERLQTTLSKTDTLSTANLSVVIGDLSHTIGRDITYYNARGILTATNRPELYESSMLPGQLSSETVRSMLTRQKLFSIEPLASTSGSFDIGYKVIQRSDREGLLGIVGVTSFRGMQIIEADIAQTIELMYGAFAALGIILLLIGAWISVRVAAPIQQLIAATERVTEGQLETIVDIKRKDEVGELAQAFNRMTGELERTRENVAQSEREGAWKEMARQVAHEIKNPLTPMKLSVQHVEHAYETGDTNFGSVFRRVIRTLSEQIDVLTRIATEFSRFGEMPRRKYGFVSLKKIVESAMALYDAERVRIRFVVDIPNSLPPMYADDEEFRRALVNLIRNALQATEGWGVILISAREMNGLIHMKLSDTGGGMSSETLKKAFDPNFSTKTSGMGLGLAIVKKIITDMSGTISVESTLGKGTTFHIELPAREYPNE